MTTPALSGPKYPIPWIATYFIVGLILIGGSFVLVWYLSKFSSEFDYDDPDMQFLESIVLSVDPRSGDFSKLNGGDWRSLCLVGWKGDAAAAQEAADIDDEPAEAMISAYERHLEALKETEFMLIYVTGSGAAKALRHPHGFAFARTGAARCTTRKEAVLAIPAVSR